MDGATNKKAKAHNRWAGEDFLKERNGQTNKQCLKLAELEAEQNSIEEAELAEGSL